MRPRTTDVSRLEKRRTFAADFLLLNSFDSLGLSAPLLEAIDALGFREPTAIQSQAIPMLLGGDRDFIGLAQTGTGKTAAFGLPLLEHIDPEQRHIQALILAPTRELGQQIAQQLDLFGKHVRGLRTVAVYGGANIWNQIQQLRRPTHVVIATPGRLLDLMKRGELHLDQVEFVVLDEADEMLNMGFKEDLDAILEETPTDKRTWLFSATMPKEIRGLVKRYMDRPLEVRVDPSQTVNTDIEHQFTFVRHTDKAEALMRFLDLDAELFGVVFCRTKRDAQDLAELLMKRGYRADALHGDLSQPQRDRVMQRFKRRDLQVLIATDVAARGIDVNDVTHVFHYSLPHDQAYYTHRSGRTARAGKQGISLAFISHKEKAGINRISRDLGISFAQVDIPNVDQIAAARVEQWATRLIQSDAPSDLAEELAGRLAGAFAGMSEFELIARLVQKEIGSLQAGADLNMKAPQQREKRPYKSFKPGFDHKSHKRKYSDKRDDNRGERGDRPYNKRGAQPFKPKGRK